MPRRTMLLLTIGLLCVAVAFLLRAFPPVAPEKAFLMSGEVRGMAISRESVLYTLNFEQQEAIIDYLNQLTPVEQAEGDKLPYEKIVVHRFDGPNQEIEIVAIDDGELILALPELKKESSGGEMLNLIQEATRP